VALIKLFHHPIGAILLDKRLLKWFGKAGLTLLRHPARKTSAQAEGNAAERADCTVMLFELLRMPDSTQTLARRIAEVVREEYEAGNVKLDLAIIVALLSPLQTLRLTKYLAL